MSQPLYERREYQRIRLERPMVGRFGSLNVLIINVGVSGALLEHHTEVGVGVTRRLTFEWNQRQIALDAGVVRSALERFSGVAGPSAPAPIYHSGVQFEAAIGQSDRLLRQMISFYVTRSLEIQKANARGIPFDESKFPDPLSSRLMAIRGDLSRGYVCCRLDHFGWIKTPAIKPVQPPDGFTVSAAEPDVDLLCSTYQEANEEGRRLIRVLAELSISETRQIPPVRYEP